MELLLQAIEEKLSHVDSERNKWLQYKEEHVQAGNNLREFQKSFRKDILVPIGSKALMPGQLYHTNEIFVGMYRGLFVKCSADKALAVCEHRLGEANKRLDALDVEHKMYKDRLVLPVDGDVFGGDSHQTQEIIEEYNEEEEIKWRAQHRIRMREYKQAEAEERNRQQSTNDIDIEAILEQAELMEELETELEQLNVTDDEHLRGHLNATNQVQAEQSIDCERDLNIDAPKIIDDSDCHGDRDGGCSGGGGSGDETGSTEFLSLNKQATGLNTEDKIKFFEIHLLKCRDYFSKTLCTIHNFDEFADKRVTEENLINAIEELQETLNNNTTETTEHKHESITIVESTLQPINNTCIDKSNACQNACIEPRKFHTPSDFDEVEREYSAQNKSKSELLIFYKSQLRNVMKSIAGCSLDIHSRDEKRDLYEFLSDRISSLREEIQKEKQIKLEEDFVDDDDVIEKSVKNLGRTFDPNGSGFDLDDYKEDESTTGKRKISFASQPVTVTFYEDDEPCVVSQENMNSLMDSTFQFFNSPSSSSASSVCGDDEDSTSHGIEHPMNSTNDCDIHFQTNQFNESTMNKVEDCTSATNNGSPAPSNQAKPSTLVLKFSHSSNPCTATVSNDDDTINSPLDIYKQFAASIETSSREILSPPHRLNVVSQLNMSQIHDKLNENIEIRNGPSIDAPFALAGQALEIPNIDAKPRKSILKNGNSVKTETRAPVIADTDGDAVEDQPHTIQQSDDFPGFTQVLGDIVERVEIVETHQVSGDNQSSADNQPKKRVSLFKRSRMS